MAKFYDMKLDVWFEADIYDLNKFTLYVNEQILVYGHVNFDDVWDNVEISDSFKSYISNIKQNWMSDGEFDIDHTIIDMEVWTVTIESSQEPAYKFIWIYRSL